jgi:hypothetical protein
MGPETALLLIPFAMFGAPILASDLSWITAISYTVGQTSVPFHAALWMDPKTALLFIPSAIFLAEGLTRDPTGLLIACSRRRPFLRDTRSSQCKKRRSRYNGE